MKICTKCKIPKELSEFGNSKAKGKFYKTSQCKVCRNKNQHAKRKLNPNKEALRKRNQRLKYNYGITLEGYQQLYDLQQGRCKICGDYYDKLAVDHCHTTSKIRGLLCDRCNHGLGHFKDRSDLLGRAILYLKETYTDKSI